MRLLAHDALIVARRVYDMIERGAEHIRSGDEARALLVLNEAASVVMANRAVLNGVIDAQEKAAEAVNLAEWTPDGPLPLGRKPAEQPHAANDDQTETPEQPGDTVA